MYEVSLAVEMLERGHGAAVRVRIWRVVSIVRWPLTKRGAASESSRVEGCGGIAFGGSYSIAAMGIMH